MKALLIARLAALLLVLALVVPSTPAAAAGLNTPFVRAVSKGRSVLHRPSYKQYNANGNRWFFQRW